MIQTKNNIPTNINENYNILDIQNIPNGNINPDLSQYNENIYLNYQQQFQQQMD